MFKKLFYLVAMVALLATASLPGGAASARSAAGDLKVNFANVTSADLVGTSPVAFKLAGSIVCDQPAVTTLVVGRVIIILALDIAVPGSSRPCGAARSGSATLTVPGQLSSGTYTVLVNPNPNGSGAAQKRFTIVVPADIVSPEVMCSAGEALPCLPQQ